VSGGAVDVASGSAWSFQTQAVDIRTRSWPNRAFRVVLAIDHQVNMQNLRA